MNKTNLLYIPLLLLLTTIPFLLISTTPTTNITKEQNKQNDISILDWQLCIERAILSTCDQDIDEQDRIECQNAATESSKCYSESSPQASVNCIHWWIYFESSQGSDSLPDSFFECSSDCLVYAKTNNFYFQQYFSPFWITCALPN